LWLEVDQEDQIEVVEVEQEDIEHLFLEEQN
jgi:hypothetical protein